MRRHKGALLAQEYVPGKRLTSALDEATARQQRDLLTAAAQSLVEIRRAAETAGLLGIVPKIGVRQGWLDDLMQLPALIAADHGIEVPAPDYGVLRDLVSPHREAFVKWDARAGNAMLRSDGSLCWFDWEHCGRRSPFDDAVWLLADEWSPDCADAEDRVLTALTRASGLSDTEVASRFYAMAVLHSFVRLSLILSRKPAQGWWSYDACLTYDKIGVTHLHFTRVCSRGARWARQSEVLRPFGRLFTDLATVIPAE
ncbi:hypothetical protein ACEN2J_12590 [Pseudorhodobacter sp. W20_MBD10_FR17]|uniref:hypothetical protein n=1 Tax=Pseudorhodobacter sp. W20_MBD10_FR17 TaxID=3240266 RepID=UPI003F9C3D35